MQNSNTNEVNRQEEIEWGNIIPFNGEVHPDEVLDAAGLDGELMSYEEWLQHVPAYEFDPEPNYHQKEYV